MEVLNNIALPQSTEHFHLLLFIYNIVQAVLLPYAALLTGALILSVRTERRAGADPYGVAGTLARHLVASVLPSRSFVTFFLLLPAVTVVFILAQVLQGTSALAPGFAAAAAILYTIAAIAGFSYRYTFRIQDLFDGRPEEGGVAGEIAAGARETHRKSGTVAQWTIIPAGFCLSAAVAIGSAPHAWSGIGSVFGALIAPGVWVTWLIFLACAAAMTGAALLFFRETGPARGLDDAKKESARLLAIRILTGGVLVLPVVLSLHLWILPVAAASGGVYALAALGVLALFGALHAVYASVRLSRPAAGSYALVFVVLATTAIASMDRIALHNATSDHAARLALAYDREAEALKTALGVGAKPLTGEDIFNAKCSACHTIDQKKVGPAYRDVLPKYKGKKAEMVGFILNPRKIDPAYPPMPSQGLKPAEADSIATYLLDKVGVKGS